MNFAYRSSQLRSMLKVLKDVKDWQTDWPNPSIQDMMRYRYLHLCIFLVLNGSSYDCPAEHGLLQST